MNDVTKAKYFLKTRGSKLQHLESFGSMLATAESEYRQMRLNQTGNKDEAGTWDAREVDSSLDYAVLRYLKKYNRLPDNAPEAFKQGVTLDEKKALAMQWANA